MRLLSFQSGSRVLGIVAILVSLAPDLSAQNAIQVFSPLVVRPSSTNTGTGANALVFNSSNLNLTCPSSGISAILSSSASGKANILVDNNIFLTDTVGQTVTGPTNVCRGGASNPNYQNQQSCFTVNGYEIPVSQGLLTGQDPDTFVATGGVAPLDVSSSLVPGPQQLTISLVDEGSGTGFYVDNSTVYLVTNCTQNGVTGPALMNGNPISSTDPTPAQLTQSFNFNPTTGQAIGFTYDLGPAEAANTLSITDQTIPQVADSPLDPTTFQTVWAAGTSFATANCLVHSGEQLANGNPACKLYTLECTVGTGANASGAQCPVSSLSNEVIKDVFDGPAFTLTDIPTPQGPTFHEGIGLLMASEGWTGGPCTFDPAANLTNLPCPQNLLTSFSGPGLYDGTSHTTHPNSTFLSIAGIPEDLTTVTVAGQQPGGWINTSTASVTFSSQPPVLPAGSVPNAANFVASPIQSITYGISSPGSLPAPGNPVPTDTVLSNSITCPTLANQNGVQAAVFTPPQQTITGLADGYYLLHYFAQDCAGTMELKFTQDANQSWSTNFYTYALNVDTTSPAVSSGPVLSPAPNAAGVYTVGQAVTASYSCTDALSGVATCGASTFASPVNATSTLTSPVDTSTPGMKSYVVTAIDAAGNQSTSSVNYQVVGDYDPQIEFSLSPTTVSFPLGANVAVTVLPTPASSPKQAPKSALKPGSRAANALSLATPATEWRPNGTVEILDGATVLKTLGIPYSGSVKYTVGGLAAGQHVLSVHYSGDGHNPAGNSAPVLLTVNPGPVQLRAACFAFWNDYSCTVIPDASGQQVHGAITYQLDSETPVSANLGWGFVFISVHHITPGEHTLTLNFAAQGSYLAAPPLVEHFSIQ
jgi:hypothetical protein